MFCHKFYIQLCVRFFHSLTFPIQKINFFTKMNNFPENDDKTKKNKYLIWPTLIMYKINMCDEN